MNKADVYEFGGSIGKTFYSGDIWRVAGFLYNQVLGMFQDFRLAESAVQKRLLDRAYELIQIVTGKEAEKK